MVLVLVAVFLRLGWWQATRAADGNLLSYGYAVQWPLFAAFVVFLWIRELRVGRRVPGGRGGGAAEAPEPHTSRRPVITARPAPAPTPDEADPELAAYNRYLAWLAANPHRRPSEYRP